MPLKAQFRQEVRLLAWAAIEVVLPASNAYGRIPSRAVGCVVPWLSDSVSTAAKHFGANQIGMLNLRMQDVVAAPYTAVIRIRYIM